MALTSRVLAGRSRNALDRHLADETIGLGHESHDEPLAQARDVGFDAGVASGAKQGADGAAHRGAIEGLAGAHGDQAAALGFGNRLSARLEANVEHRQGLEFIGGPGRRTPTGNAQQRGCQDAGESNAPLSAL